MPHICSNRAFDIITIKELMGHEAIETTMIYLHIAQPSAKTAFSPRDNLYKKG